MTWDINALIAMLPPVWVNLLIPLITFFLTLFFCLSVRWFVFKRLTAWSHRSKNELDDLIIDSTRAPSIIWSGLLAIYWALEISPLPEHLVGVVGRGMLILTIISLTLVVSNILNSLIKVYSHKMDATRPVTSLTQNISRIGVFGIGLMIILKNMGVSVTPLLATLGVGGLAMALALQETLANLFSGFYIVVSRQIKVGDYIKLDSGEEGYVLDITWRTTQIRVLPDNEVLVPNEKLTKAIITNYNLPVKEMSVLVEMGVHFNSDLKKVEQVTVEVAREVMNTVSGGVPGYEPYIRFHTFGDFSINFTVYMRSRQFEDQILVKHEFIKKIQERFAREGIVIPMPVHAVNYSQEKANVAD